MGRGSSKAGGGSVGGGNNANNSRTPSDIVRSENLNAEFNDSTSAQRSAQELYDNQLTMAFPSTASVVNRVPALKQMQDTMKDAPVGTTVVGRFRNDEVRVMEKTSDTSWKVTDMVPDSAGNGMYNGRKPGNYRGIKAIQQMQHILNESTRERIPHGASISYKEGR